MDSQDPLRNNGIDEVCRLFSKAENSIKKYELERQELHYPAVNQLRYAGHHLAKAIQLDKRGADSEQIEENVKQAKNHCRRAYFDSMESVLLDRISTIDGFFSKYFGSEHLSQEIPNYGDIQSRTKTIQDEIEKIRAEIYEDRTDMFDQISPFLPELDSFANEVELKAPRIAALDIRNARKFVLSVVLSILGILVTALGIIITWRIGG